MQNTTTDKRALPACRSLQQTRSLLRLKAALAVAAEVQALSNLECDSDVLEHFTKAVERIDFSIEMLPGVACSEIAEVMIQELIGDYDVPEEKEEWHWIEAHASYSHAGNGQDGVWEFILNLARMFEGVPPTIKRAIDQARSQGCSHILFHQGT